MKQAVEARNRRRLFSLLLIVIIITIAALGSFFLIRQYNAIQQEKQTNTRIEAAAETAFGKCRKATWNWGHCYEIQVETMAKNYPLQVSLLALKRLKLLDQRVIGCHVIAHAMMRQYVRDAPDKWITFLSEIDPYDCNYGFFHGIIETKNLVDKNFAIDAKTIPIYCKEFQQHVKGAALDQTCSHIMGHLLLIEEDTSVPKALAVCQDLPEHMHRECFAGTFMENFTRDNVVAHGEGEHIPWDDKTIKSLENLCLSVDDEQAFSCWQEMSHLYNYRTPDNPEKVYAQCETAKTEAFINACYMHAVNTLVETKTTNREYLARICKPYARNSLLYTSCLNTSIRSLVYSDISLTKRALLLCDAAPEEDKKSCYSILVDALRKRGDTKAAVSWCKQIPIEGQEFCKRLANG